MSVLETIVLTCKDISPSIFSNYTELLMREETLRTKLQGLKEELRSLGIDPDDKHFNAKSNDAHTILWQYMDSVLEKQTREIKLAKDKFTLYLKDYELIQSEISTKFKELQKANYKIMEMIAYVIQEIAYNDEQTHKRKTQTQTQKKRKIEDKVEEDEDEEDKEDEDVEDEDVEDECDNPDYPKMLNKNKSHKGLMFVTTIVEPLLIIVLSVLLLCYYKPETSVISVMI
jgi:anthranilate/para-aminobenzoate synthase component I